MGVVICEQFLFLEIHQELCSSAGGGGGEKLALLVISIVALSSVLSLRKLIKISTSSGRVVFVGTIQRGRTLNVSL